MSPELRQRLLTGIPLAIVVIALLLFSNQWVFWATLTVIIALAAWEWVGFAGFSTVAARAAYTALVVVLIIASATGLIEAYRYNLLWVASIFWVFALVWLVPQYPKYSRWFFASPFIVLASGLLVLVSAWHGLEHIARLDGAESRLSLLWFLLYIWLADIGAYFTGRAIGKHKLMPNVSPSKTWQGFAGGAVAVCVFALLLGLFTGKPTQAVLLGVLAVVVFSVVGDLTESCYKRTVGIKDSGRLLPGHGGMMDRIDSVVAAAPVYYILSLLPV